MSNQTIITRDLVVEGRPIEVSIIDNPTIDDMVVTEMALQAVAIETGNEPANDRHADRAIIDYLIRLGVER